MEELGEAKKLRQKAQDLESSRGRSAREAGKKAESLATEGECPACEQPRQYDPDAHEKALKSEKLADKKLSKASSILSQAKKSVRALLVELGEEEDILKTWGNQKVEHDKALSSCEAKIGMVQASIDSAEERIKEAEQDELEQKNKIKTLTSKKDLPISVIKENNERVELADWWVKGFGPKGVPAYAIEQSLPVLNEKANRHLLELADGDIEVRWTATTIGSSGVVKEELTQNVTIEGTVGAAPSGGQSKKIELATELALAELMEESEGIGANILLLDEALDGLDVEGQDRVIEWVHRCLPHEAVFVVSHDEAIADSFESRLVVTKKGQSSKVAWSV